MRKTGFISSLVLVLFLMLCILPVPVLADDQTGEETGRTEMTYADEEDNYLGQSCIIVDEGTTEWKDDWYAVTGDVTIDSRIEVTGDVKLVVDVDASTYSPYTLTAVQGIHVAPGNSLTIYTVSTMGGGRITITDPGDGNAGIGGNSGESGGAVTISTIENITVTAGSGAEAIGKGAGGAESGDLTLSSICHVSNDPVSGSTNMVPAEERVSAARESFAMLMAYTLCHAIQYKSTKTTHQLYCPYCGTSGEEESHNMFDGETYCYTCHYNEAVIDFDTNGGGWSYKDPDGSGYTMFRLISIGKGSTFTLTPGPSDPPEDYTFAGWQIGSDTTLHQPGETFTVTGDVILTAQWKLDPWLELEHLVNEAEEGSTVVLERDYTAAEDSRSLEFDSADDITLDLNGHTIDRNLDSAASDGYAFEITSKSKLTLTDNSSNGGGTITGGYNASFGGAIDNYGELTIAGPIVIQNNKAKKGSAISNHGTLLLASSSDARIQYNETTGTDAEGDGTILNQGTLTIQGGTISGNTAENGAAVYNRGGLTIGDGSFQGNTADLGGAIFNDEGTVTITGGRFYGNTAVYYGSALYNIGGTVNLNGGTFQANRASGTEESANTGFGTIFSRTNKAGEGALVVAQGNDYSDDGNDIVTNTLIQNNIAKYGAGIYLDSGELRISGGPVITENRTSMGLSTNVFLSTDTVMTVDGPLTESADIGVEVTLVPMRITSGLPGNGSLDNFSGDMWDVFLDEDGEAVLDMGYSISIPQNLENGSIAVDQTRVRAGSTITLQSEPSDGYELSSLSISNEKTETDIEYVNNGDDTYSFTMPESDVEVSAAFRSASGKLWVGSRMVNGINESDILGDGTVSYDPASSTLTMTDASICGGSSEHDGAVCAEGIEELNIVYHGDNLLRAAYDTGIMITGGDLTVTGDGTLTIVDDGEAESGYYPAYRGITNWDGRISFAGTGTVSVKSTQPAVWSCEGGLTIAENLAITTPANGSISGGQIIDPVTYDWAKELVIRPRPDYTVSIAENIENGEIQVDVSPANAGETITVKAVPKARYILNTLEVKTDSGEEVPVTNKSFVMPESNVTVTATFTLNPVNTITVKEDFVFHATFDFEGVTVDEEGTMSAEEGDTVIVHVTPEEGYKTANIIIYTMNKYGYYNDERVEVTQVGSNTFSFIMPDNYVQLTDASFVKADRFTVTYQAGDEAAEGEMDADVVYDGDDFTLPECAFTAPEGMAFKGWSVKTGEDEAVTMAAGDVITVSGDVTVTAVWGEYVPVSEIETEPGPGTESESETEPESPTVIPDVPAPQSEPANELGEDGTALGKGASAEAAEAAILAMTSDEAPAGSQFRLLQLRSVKQTKNSVTITWKAVDGAKKYVIYGNRCGSKMKKLTTITPKAKARKYSKAFKKVAGKKVAKGKYYKFLVVALDKNDTVLTSSKTIHAAVKSAKIGNYKSVTTAAKKNKVAIKKGKTFKLKAKAVAQSGKLKVKSHRKILYESSKTSVATVSKKGVIKAKKKGTCYVYAYAQNGVFAKIKVTVKG